MPLSKHGHCLPQLWRQLQGVYCRHGWSFPLVSLFRTKGCVYFSLRTPFFRRTPYKRARVAASISCTAHDLTFKLHTERREKSTDIGYKKGDTIHLNWDAQFLAMLELLLVTTICDSKDYLKFHFHGVSLVSFHLLLVMQIQFIACSKISEMWNEQKIESKIHRTTFTVYRSLQTDDAEIEK